MPVHRIGFTELLGSHDARNGPFRVNIIFVHGLRGHPQHTWEDSRDRGSEGKGSANRGSKDGAAAAPRKRNILKTLFKSKTTSSTSISATTSIADDDSSEESTNKVFWPNEYLIQDIPEARVWTYGYNADTIGGLFQANNKNSVSQHGRDLAVRAEREIQNENPIVFVAHSLGGIIVKDAIRRSDTCRARTKLIIFLGTPHRGTLLALQDSNKNLIKTLEVNSEVLDRIHEEFTTIADQSRIQIHSFQEARGISGIKGLHNKVVDDFSSKLDLPRSLETVESIDADHMQMARCCDRADPQYRVIVGVLQQFMQRMTQDETRLQERLSITLRVNDVSNTTTGRSVLPCYYIPLPENRCFVGRSSTLDTLKTKLFQHKECRKAAIVGLGGVGKTQFSIFWVSASSSATFEQAFTAIAKKLPGPWLLVVDNADDMNVLFGSADMPGGISEYLPESDNGLILFTTRSREIAVSVSGGDMIELYELDPPEAVECLANSLIQKDMLRDEAAAVELLKELTYLPLAITQAVAYINIKQVPFSEYVELVHGTQEDVLGLMSREFRDNTRYPGSQNTVATTWLVSFKQIRESHKAAADLLSFISCIEPKGIPQSLLPGYTKSTEQLVDTIGTLCSYAFLTRRGDSKVFDMHSLVHLAARIWVQREGRMALMAKKAIRHLAIIFPSHDYANRNLWREYFPHVFKLLQQNKELNIKERFELLFWVGRCLMTDGRIKQAARGLEEASQWRNRHFAEDHPSRLSSQYTLAVVAIEAKTLAEDHPDRLASQHKLAIAYRDNGQVKEAIALL
ncbi:putative kinesin light chain [Corynascus novoguineensis]|uniref:Kinesin light chain n=1 Tax=Corynascus novoguineensis TaxID=1126955 RepID=A0AAN7CXY6_9PEZI|nr:putative kinesin light chain [Corynascus novoguineensis]